MGAENGGPEGWDHLSTPGNFPWSVQGCSRAVSPSVCTPSTAHSSHTQADHVLTVVWLQGPVCLLAHNIHSVWEGTPPAPGRASTQQMHRVPQLLLEGTRGQGPPWEMASAGDRVGPQAASAL